jgi:signal transduction histidine kinase
MRWYGGLLGLLGVTAAVELAMAEPARPLPFVALAVMVVALLSADRFPLAGSATALVAFAAPLLLTGHLMPALGDPPNSIAVGALVLVATYVAGTHPSPLRGLVGLLVAELVMLAHLVLYAPVEPPTLNDKLAAGIVPTVLPWMAGLVVARHRRLGEVERQVDEVRIAAAEERSRIAREVHDLVAHSVSLMVVQAEAAEALLPTSPSRTADSLRAVQEAGRSALQEMRRTVGALRSGQLETASSMAELPTLLQNVRDAGLPVTVVTAGQPVELPADVDNSVFHVLREALTNALRHSDHSGVQVRLGYQPDGLEVTVLDTGRPRSRHLSGGHGLAGLKERISALGGELDAGPTPTGEHVVHARVPLAAR